MNIYIANFAQLRKMDSTCIPISTAVWRPKFFKLGLDKNNVMLGITEPELSPYKVDMSDGCTKGCPHIKENPNCPFLIKYAAWLDSVDFNYIMSEFNRVAEDVRKITHFVGEPNIVLLVYEAVNNPCSERIPLRNWFDKHGIKVLNYEDRD